MPDTIPLTDLSDALAGLVQQAAPVVAGVHGGSRRGASGLIWQDGIVVTAEEALRRDNDLRVVLPSGETVAATLAGRDPSTDIAVLRVEGAVGSAPEPAPNARSGELALALGRRHGAVVSRLGIVSQAGEAWRSMRGGRIDQFIRLDLSLDASLEGGAVVDAAGRLMGMPVFGPRGRVLVIPAATIARVVPQILAGGNVGRGYLGLGLHRVGGGRRNDAAGQAGVIVVSIDPDGPGAAAGALLGDVITSWNDEPIGGMRDIIVRLGSESVGAAVELGLVRAGATTKVTLNVGKRPAG
jgi:S1-C subfamily serine protease